MDPTTEWAPSPEHPGYKEKVIKHGNCTVVILRPELDKAERAKRERYVQAAAAAALSNYYKRKEQTP